MNKRWIIEDVEFNKEIVDINPVILEILSKRGLKEKEEIIKFLQGDLADLHDPFLFRDMNKAVNRIKKAISNKEKVIIYGDYDVDGITSTALLYNYLLENYNFEVDYYIPDRIKEGYGLNINAVKNLAPDYDLLITVDCGITAYKEVEVAREAGLDVIITDHHQPAAKLPRANAILNPHIKDDNYPCKYLAGVGVAFKVCQALDKNWSDYLDLVALATVADIVPLKDENHILVKQGLLDMENSDNFGLNALLEKLNLSDKTLTAGKIGYIVAPPLNAAGRIEDPRKAIKLLTVDNKKEAEPIAEELKIMNKKRQLEEEEIFKQAVEMVEKELDFSSDRCIILASEDWHPGIIGIVASRLVERYYLPVVMIALSGGKGKGSCRSINGVNIYELLTLYSDILLEYGGHAQAAGLTIEANKISVLKNKLNNYLNENFEEIDFVPQIKLDSVVEEEEINRDLYNDLNKMMPFGFGNPRPRFLITNTSFKKIYTVGKKDKHLKFTLENGISGIGFNFGHLKNDLFNSQVDIAFNIKLNKWQGQEELQINLLDINLRQDAKIFPVAFRSEKLLVYDKRGCTDIYNYLDKLSNSDSCIGIYINNKRKHDKFRDFFADEKMHFFTGTDLLPSVKLEELVLISLPFSRTELSKMIELLQSDNVKLHLLYGREDYYTGCKLIKNHFSEAQNKLDFSKSIRYNEITDIIDEYNRFTQLAYAKNLFKLIGMVKNIMQEEDDGF